jgi:hypothetical protein
MRGWDCTVGVMWMQVGDIRQLILIYLKIRVKVKGDPQLARSLKSHSTLALSPTLASPRPRPLSRLCTTTHDLTLPLLSFSLSLFLFKIPLLGPTPL